MIESAVNKFHDRFFYKPVLKLNFKNKMRVIKFFLLLQFIYVSNGNSITLTFRFNFSSGLLTKTSALYNRLFNKVKTQRRQRAMIQAMQKCDRLCNYTIDSKGFLRNTFTAVCTRKTDTLCRKIAYMIQNLWINS